MKKTKRLWALLLVMVMALGLITTAFAAPTIDSGRKASLSLYKYDITAASADGAWDAASYRNQRRNLCRRSSADTSRENP